MAVSRRPLAAEARIQSHGSSCGICGGQRGTEGECSPGTSAISCHSPFHQYSILMYRHVWYKRHIYGRSATGPKVRGPKPSRGRWILRVIKSVARFPSEGK
jgi:hypothetical protein